MTKRWTTIVYLTIFFSFCSGLKTDSEIEGLVGADVKLPCNVTIDDKVTVLLWKFKKVLIYAVDFRQDFSKPIHSTDDDRLKFITKATNFSPFLKFDKITLADEGFYTCTVSYEIAPTDVIYTRLNVIEPPTSISILDKLGKEVQGTIGPFDEGSEAEMICQVKGGHPPPTVKWFRGGSMLDDTIDVTGTGALRNKLMYGPLTRTDYLTKLTCQASNNVHIEALQQHISVNVNYWPRTVNILTEETALIAGKLYKINCSSSGALPAAKVTWWLDSKPLSDVDTMTNSENVTFSLLSFTPSDSDADKKLQCKSESPIMVHKPLWAFWKLKIHYKPKVRMMIEPQNKVREGDKVVLNCIIDANPAASNTTWYYKRKKITPYQWRNMEIINNTLVLSSVTRHMAGIFSCFVSNSAGSDGSEGTILHVKYIPVCEEKNSIVGAVLQETIDIHCRFKSFPILTSVRWQVNVSESRVIDIPKENFYLKDTESVLSYKINTVDDFGQLLCWGQNELGEQPEPCVFKVVKATVPEKPTNCTNVNHTSNSVTVMCIAGYNGGLVQNFHANVLDMVKKVNLQNISLSDPLFVIDALPDNTDFLLTIYSENSKGASETQLMQVYTSIIKEGGDIDYSITKAIPITPILGILIGIVGALVVVAMVIMMVMRLKAGSSDKKKKDDVNKPLTPDDSSQRPRIINEAELEAAKGSEKLMSSNYYETTQTTFSPVDRSFEIRDFPNPDAEYAELLFNKAGKKKKKKLSKKNGQASISQDSTIYASIDHVQTEKQKLIQKQRQASVDQLKAQQHHLSSQQAPTPPPTPPPELFKTSLNSPEVLIASPVTMPHKALEVKPPLTQRVLPHEGVWEPKAKELSIAPRKSSMKPMQIDKPPIARKPESLKAKKKAAEIQTQIINDNESNQVPALLLSKLTTESNL